MQNHHPDDRLYHIEALWVRPLTATDVLIGVSHYAQSCLGEVLYVDLPESGAVLSRDAAFGTIESHKSVSDLVAPVGGEILAVNDQVLGAPGLVNDDPYENGWLIQVRLQEPIDVYGLLSADAYAATLPPGDA